MENVTVGELIDALSKFDRNDPVEISVVQYNKKFPVAYCEPKLSGRMQNSLASKENGVNVRLSIHLPWNSNEYMMTSVKKLK